MNLEVPSILITDDDRGFRETLRMLFAERGFRPLLAADGEEALEVFRNEPVHLALVDMHMPRLDGLETIRRVREFTVLSAVPAADLAGTLLSSDEEPRRPPPWILLSAALDDRVTAIARALDAFSILAKPVSFSELTQSVGQAMRATYDWPRAA